MKTPDQQNSTVIIQKLKDFWQKENFIKEDHQFQLEKYNQQVASIFAPGPFYYFIFDLFNLRFIYVHPDVQQVTGTKPEEYSLEGLVARLHPDDLLTIQQKEAAAAVFYFQKCPKEKMTSYKSTYTFRLKHLNGQWVTIYQQSIPIVVTEDGKINYALTVHSDISHLHTMPDDRISFLGLDGEPSFFSLSTDPAKILEPDPELHISEREKEIIRLLAEGLSSKQVADRLFLSAHTVNTHRRNLLIKTNTKNTLELTALCIRKGIF